MNTRDTSSYSGDDRKAGKIIRLIIGGFAAIIALMLGLLAMFVIPAPNNQALALRAFLEISSFVNELSKASSIACFTSC